MRDENGHVRRPFDTIDHGESLRLLKRPEIYKPILVRDSNDVSNVHKDHIGDSGRHQSFRYRAWRKHKFGFVELLLNHLPSRRQFDEAKKRRTRHKTKKEKKKKKQLQNMEKKCGALVHLDDTFTVNGVGTVVSGVITRGLSRRTSYYSWDSSLGHFKEVVVKSTMTHRTSILKTVCMSIREFRHKSKKQQGTSAQSRHAPKA